MKIATLYKDAYEILRENYPFSEFNRVIAPMNKPYKQIGIDIGKQFGTRIVMHITPETAWKLLTELEKRDLPCPQVFDTGSKILIGADPE